jgi:hypothetical protein
MLESKGELCVGCDDGKLEHMILVIVDRVTSGAKMDCDFIQKLLIYITASGSREGVILCSYITRERDIMDCNLDPK